MIFKNILTKIKDSRFNKGYSGLAIKNSVNQISTVMIIKIGSLIFTAIIARILMPELFGLYSLVFSTIFTFSSLADMGVGTALTHFVSRALSKDDEKKAKTYYSYLFKLKIILTGLSFIVLLLSAKFIATTYYQKPIFLALLFGSLLMIVLSMINFIEYLFRSYNRFQGVVWKESFFQISRIILSPILIILLLKYSISEESSVLIVISSIFLPYLATLIFFSIKARKEIIFLKQKSSHLDRIERKKVNKFILPLSISLVLYTVIDQVDVILLGRFVTSEFIGYYSAAFSLISPATAFTALSIALLPIFSRLEGEQLKRGLKKSVLVTSVVAVFFTFMIVLLSPLMMGLVYGENYSPAINLLRLGSLVIIPSTLAGIYVNFFVSRGKTYVAAKVLGFVAATKIIFGYFLVSNLVKISLFDATVGVISARIISEYIYLAALVFICMRFGTEGTKN